MPVDNLGQTFRFIVEQAGGGGGGGGGASDSTGGAGGSPGRVARDANQYRDTMAKMVKAVDHSGKTTQDAFTKGFRAVGLQITMANMLKQSQIFTGTLNAIFQVIGALFDIVLAPFMPLIVKFMQKAIPRLLDFAERMAAWVRGELAQLDELGFMGYIQKKLEEDIPKAFETFGPVVAAQIGIASKFIINAIPGTVAIALTSLGILTAEVLGATVSGIGELLVLTLDKSLDAMSNVMAFLMDKMAGLKIKNPFGEGVWEPFSSFKGAGDALREGTEGTPDWLTKMRESTIPELAESVKTLTRNTFDWAADIFRSATAVDLFEELSVIVQNWVEKGVIGVFDATASAAGELGGEFGKLAKKVQEVQGAQEDYYLSLHGGGINEDLENDPQGITPDTFLPSFISGDSERDPLYELEMGMDLAHDPKVKSTIRSMTNAQLIEAIQTWEWGHPTIGDTNDLEHDPQGLGDVFRGTLWDKMQDWNLLTKPEDRGNFIGGWQQWHPLKGWNMVPGNWQSGEDGIWDAVQNFDAMPGQGATWNPVKGWDLSGDAIVETVEGWIQGLFGNKTLQEFSRHYMNASQEGDFPTPGGYGSGGDYFSQLEITVKTDPGSSDVLGVSDTKMSVKNGEKHQIDVWLSSDPQGLGDI